MFKTIRQFAGDESGAAAMDYVLIASLIAIAFIAGAGLLGDSVTDLFTEVGEGIDRQTVTNPVDDVIYPVS